MQATLQNSSKKFKYMLKNLKKYIKSYVYKKRLCYKNNSFLHVGVTVSHSTCLEGYNIIYYNTNIVDSSIGAGSYIGMDSQIVKTKVGRFTSIGNRVKTCFGSHPTSKFISTHPSFFSIDKQAGFSFVKKNIFEEYKYFDSKNKIICDIGNDVWIGDNVCIMDGLKIGDGAIIGAGSIVTKDIEPYSINVGVPSRPVSYRFTPDKIKLLQNIAWWNKDLEWIKNNSEFFKDIDLFLNKLNETK